MLATHHDTVILHNSNYMNPISVDYYEIKHVHFHWGYIFILINNTFFNWYCNYKLSKL